MGSNGSVKDRHGYPRPMMERSEWTNLNGRWDFAIDADAKWISPEQVVWDRHIQVPFSPETKLSGVHDTGFYREVWYRREITPPDLSGDRQLMIRFEGVDYAATVWVNGRLAGKHEGGYTPFRVDATELLTGTGKDILVVRAEDDPLDLTKPRGKQDWQLQPHSIWYPRTTGIWQTVWMERLSATHLRYVRWTPVVERWEIGFETRLEGTRRKDLRLHVRLEAHDKILSDDVYSVQSEEVHRRIALSDPGIDDSRNELLWSPGSPVLIRALIELIEPDGTVIDEVHSYTALRSISIQGDRFVLNGRPYPLQMVLDQGYFPDSGITAPDDNALRHDVELAKAMGFNGVRKHQKIEDPRYLYWADTLGLLVWEEMPSAYRFTRTSIERLTREWTDVIRRDISHPCIVAWVPFNESWGVPDLPEMPAQRHYVQALYHLTKTLDPSRPVIGNDGWESVATDIIGIHDYDDNPARIERRYGKEDIAAVLLKRERPGGRLLSLSENAHQGLPVMITEFGGIAFSENKDTTWGYTRTETTEGLANQYCELLAALRSIPMLAGFCYTQFADTYQEANGLLYADRTPKFPLKQMALATRGPRNRLEQHMETAWRRKNHGLQSPAPQRTRPRTPDANRSLIRQLNRSTQQGVTMQTNTHLRPQTQQPSSAQADEGSKLFQSFWLGGFESACQINTRGQRIDMLAATQHDVLAREDYAMVRAHGIRAVRDGVRWPCVETSPGHYDWSTFLPMVRAANAEGVQVIWNLLHYGWPPDIDILSGAFVDRFAQYCAAAARIVKNETAQPPFFVPVNEISFLAWAVGYKGIIQPLTLGKSWEIKQQLVRAAIAGMNAVREVDSRAKFVHVDPVIHIMPPRDRPDLTEQARIQREGQFEAWDMLCGKSCPELGESAGYIDVVGVNYYHANQFETPDVRLRWEDEPRDDRFLPFHKLLDEMHQRYGKPLLVAETSHFGQGRGKWIREIAEEAYIARMQGIPLEGVCIYPIIDRPDWEDMNHWHNSGLWDLRRDENGRLERVPCEEYLKALQESQSLLKQVACG